MEVDMTAPKTWMSRCALVTILTGSVLSVTLFASTRFGSARLHQINGSGIEAAVVFRDDGVALTVKGVASGMTPGQAYVSLLYGRGSAADGPKACEPTANPNESLNFPQMLVGMWVVDASGNGTLDAAKTGGSYTPLTSGDTMSIREFNPPD